MVGSGIVVEFPSGRPVVAGSSRGAPNRSVARMVRRLSGIGRADTCPEPDAPFPIRLRELAGVNDEIVDSLAGLVRKGIVTPTSAARLAMRHADECSPRRPVGRPIATGAACYELKLAGDPFGQFALHLQGRSTWIVFAPARGLGYLAELSVSLRSQACLLIGSDAGRRITVRLLDPATWRRCIGDLSAGGARCGSRHVLLIGGLPCREPERSCALIEIEHAIRRGGNTVLISSNLRKAGNAGYPAPVPESARELMTMIELTFPGLIEADASIGGHAR